MSELVFVTRYGVGLEGLPDPVTVCKGHCEGMGCYPVSNPDFDPGEIRSVDPLDEADLALWWEAHNRHCSFRGTVRDLWKHREWWYWRSIWRDMRATKSFVKCRADGGYHFVKCGVCDGTGKAA